jgi:hypothetical protein
MKKTLIEKIFPFDLIFIPMIMGLPSLIGTFLFIKEYIFDLNSLVFYYKENLMGDFWVLVSIVFFGFVFLYIDIYALLIIIAIIIPKNIIR